MSTETTTAPADRLRAHISAGATHTLAAALRLADNATTAEERLVRARLIEELENRYPAASDAVRDAFDAWDDAVQAGAEDLPDPDYVAVLLANIPAADLVSPA